MQQLVWFFFLIQTTHRIQRGKVEDICIKWCVNFTKEQIISLPHFILFFAFNFPPSYNMGVQGSGNLQDWWWEPHFLIYWHRDTLRNNQQLSLGHFWTMEPNQSFCVLTNLSVFLSFFLFFNYMDYTEGITY